MAAATPPSDRTIVSSGLVSSQASSFRPPHTPKTIMPSISNAMPENLAKLLTFFRLSFLLDIGLRCFAAVHLAVAGEGCARLNG